MARAGVESRPCFPRDAGFASRGMLALPPALISRKPLRGGAGYNSSIRVFGDGGCDSSQVFISFSTLQRRRVYGTCVPGSPLPCPTGLLPWRGFPVCWFFGGAVGKGKSPACVSDKVMNHRSRGDIFRAEGGVAVEPERHSPAGKETAAAEKWGWGGHAGGAPPRQKHVNWG